MDSDDGAHFGARRGVAATACSILCRDGFRDAALLNPLDAHPHARFLAFRSARAQGWYSALIARNCITDVRGDVLRIGFGIYQDEADVDRLVQLLGGLA